MSLTWARRRLGQKAFSDCYCSRKLMRLTANKQMKKLCSIETSVRRPVLQRLMVFRNVCPGQEDPSLACVQFSVQTKLLHIVVASVAIVHKAKFISFPPLPYFFFSLSLIHSASRDNVYNQSVHDLRMKACFRNHIASIGLCARARMVRRCERRHLKNRFVRISIKTLW